MNDDTQITFVDNVWESCSETKEEAELKKLKAQMMVVIREMIISNGWTAAHTAKMLGLTQPRTSNLINGQISKFSLDALYKIMVTCRVSLDLKMSDKGQVSCDVTMQPVNDAA